MRKLHVTSSVATDKEQWLQLLAQAGIRAENSIEEVFGIFDGGKLAATAARYRNIIKCVAVGESYRGTNVINELIGGVYTEVFNAGYHACFVYTKKEARDSFLRFGFRDVEQADETVYFMEHAVGGFRDYLEELRTHRLPLDARSGVCKTGQEVKRKTGREGVRETENADRRCAAVVMNANPFTLGHLHLVTRASRENDLVHLFVLSEEMSAFRAAARIELVRQGTAHLKNVIIHPTSDYLVSAATFPAYFLKEHDDITRIQAKLDSRIFINHIAPALGITVRYVGTEPFSIATEIYNNTMQEAFCDNVKLIVLDRYRTEEGEVVSASTVRTLLASGNVEKAGKLVPPTTRAYFFTEEGRRVIKAL